MTKICEIRQISKGDLIKFCEIFTKITLGFPQNSQKPLFECMMLEINTTKCDICLFLHNVKWTENAVCVYIAFNNFSVIGSSVLTFIVLPH